MDIGKLEHVNAGGIIMKVNKMCYMDKWHPDYEKGQSTDLRDMVFLPSFSMYKRTIMNRLCQINISLLYIKRYAKKIINTSIYQYNTERGNLLELRKGVPESDLKNIAYFNYFAENLFVRGFTVLDCLIRMEAQKDRDGEYLSNGENIRRLTFCESSVNKLKKKTELHEKLMAIIKSDTFKSIKKYRHSIIHDMDTTQPRFVAKKRREGQRDIYSFGYSEAEEPLVLISRVIDFMEILDRIADAFLCLYPDCQQ
jgi:hypothetical protein